MDYARTGRERSGASRTASAARRLLLRDGVGQRPDLLDVDVNDVAGFEELVEYISGAMTLRPGDVISTGTPGGVGVFSDPPELLEPGDVVDVNIEEIGTLSNTVAKE